MVKGAVKTGIKASTRVGKNLLKRAGKSLPRGGKTFEQFKRSYWKGKNKPDLDPIRNDATGQVWKQYHELHHRFISQRLQKKYNLPNWLVNNRLNLQQLKSLDHALRDPYRARFAPKWVKELYNLNWK